jgi:CYTH domain-containing protein
MKNLETERKFLVDREKWSQLSKPAGVLYRQGYLSIDADKVVRVRVAGDRGYLTVKGKSETISRPEFEYAIPAGDALEMLDLFVPSGIIKTRTRIPAGKHTWEVDEFQGDNEGLVVAEIELEDADEIFEKPGWVGEEVTGDERYYNARLSIHPYRTWKKQKPPESQ